MHETSSLANPDSQQLCQACGLCCKGVWFSHVPLGDDEIEAASQVGLKVELHNASASFYQSCVMHKENRCSIYEGWRPRACISYSCALLDAYLVGNTSFETALTHVQAARVMAERIQAETGLLTGGLKGKQFFLRFQPSTAEGNKEKTALSPDSRMDAVALSVYFERFFKKPSASDEPGSTEELPSRND